MKRFYLNFLLLLFTTSLFAQADKVSVVQNAQGMKLVVNGEDFMINGMNWDYFPIGTNFNYSLWKQPDDIIRSALDSEMSLLKNMGVNAVRMYTGVPAKWITYIHDKYGIYTMLNHSFGRYGLTLDAAYVANTDYADPRVRKLLLSETTKLVNDYKDTPGLLMFLLGNENNYGLFWDGAETEDIPIKDRKSTKRARDMYRLFEQATVAMKKVSTSHPIAICNGDLLFLDIIAEECKSIDIYGTNMYRGVSFGDAFQRVRDEYGKPILFTEFGADAYNAQANQEDQEAQAYYMVGNWKEIYENAAGLGKANNSLGGFTFQFSDGWWKYGQTERLDIHDNNASWSNGGYQRDFEEGENNMNEEWFGICAKGPNNERGLYQLFPRAAYYALKEVHTLNPMVKGASLEAIDSHFAGIALMDAVIKARGDKAALETESLKKIRVSDLRADLRTFSTGGERISTGRQDISAAGDGTTTYPDQLGFDHMQSYFVGVEAKPSESVRAKVVFNALGNVATNPINEIFYENRGRPVAIPVGPGETRLTTLDRFQVYQAEFDWKSKHFDVNGFYRTGHYHWGYEGDFFGLYPEANYGPNIDIYNGRAPFGFEVEGKKGIKGLKLAFGPELWWGANPAILAKYTRKVGKFDITGVYHEDIANQAPAVTSFAIPIPQTRRAALHIGRDYKNGTIEVGGIWSNSNRVGETFQILDRSEGVDRVLQDKTVMNDTWGGKAKVTFSKGPINWYAQGAAMGILAQGGADLTQTFTGWKLKDSGSGNQINFLTGFTYGIGNFQIAPNFLWQRPIEDPIPGDVAAPGRPRNILDDPFAVRWNRETVAGEILFTFDPTPGTWMYQWDNDRAEDAKFAMNLGFIYRHLPTTMDAAIGILADGRSIFAFPGAAPAQDLWEVNSRIVSKINPEFGLVANLYGGTAQARGSDPRLIERFGGDIRAIYKNFKITGMAKVNDWGPFDYHRDFNLTFPLQLVLDVSTTLGKPKWFDLPSSRLGVRYTWRSLDEFSPRYCPTTIIDAGGNVLCDPTARGFEDGTEWEVQTYFQVNLSN